MSQELKYHSHVEKAFRVTCKALTNLRCHNNMTYCSEPHMKYGEVVFRCNKKQKGMSRTEALVKFIAGQYVVYL